MKKQMYDTIDGRVLRSFQIIKKVGQGAYGQVWKARNKKTGSICALKKIYEAFRNCSDAQKAYREIKYLQKLDHPSIIKLLNIHKPFNSRDIYLELEFMEADLCIALKNSVLKEIHKHYIFYQLINTVNYLHAAELIHRDIKPSNILVNQTCEVKLCDFGLIRSLKKDSPAQETVLTENIATRWYRAPEILLCSNNYGKPIDIWSVGCVLAEMIMQKPIFQGSSTISQLEKIFEVTGKPTAEDLDYLKSKSSLNVIENMQIRERKTMKELLNTNDKNIIDLLQKIFQVDPKKRPTASEVLNHPFITKFRGKVEEKLPPGAIKILYEVKQLPIEDYQNLIYGQADEKNIKLSEQAINCEQLIYKTLPNDLGRRNIIANYPWGKIQNKSPMHSSNMNQKSLSPLGFKPKQEKTFELSKDKKQERHSPSFLYNKKKQAENTPNKVAPEKLSIEKNTVENFKIMKKRSFPLSNKQSESPEKIVKNSKLPNKELIKASSAINLQKTNPQKMFESDKQLQTIYEYKYSQDCNQATQASSFFRALNSSQNESNKSKEKRPAPKFILQGDRKVRQTSITPNKEKYEPQQPTANKSPIKSTSPFSRPLPHAYSFQGSSTPTQAKAQIPYSPVPYSRVSK